MKFNENHYAEIKNFWPKDTNDEMYLDGTFAITLNDFIEKAKEKWPCVDFNDIDINAEYIHTRCLTYDLYNSGDWTTFIVLRKKQNAMDQNQS